MAESPRPLDYHVPGPIDRHYSPVLALMLCAPGAASFGLLFLLASRIADSFPSSVGAVLGDLFWPLWFLAVATAVTSVCLYVRFPLRALPSYVKLNLVINISGLLFSAFAFATTW